MAPWKLPLLVAAIAVPIAVAFYLGGPGVGVAIGALVAVGIVIGAARARPRGPIGRVPSAGRPRVLLLAACAIEDPATIAAIAGRVTADSDPAEILVLAPARIGFLARWASDVEAARREAQQNLVITVASLAKVGIAAEAQVGDEDLVQAVEDATRSFAATEVILATAGAERDPAAPRAAAELRRRLRPPFRWLEVDGG